LQIYKTFAIPEPLEMLHVGTSAKCISIGNLSAECAVLPSSNNVAAIPDEARAKAIQPRERI